MRGKRSGRGMGFDLLGNIPAYAGKTAWRVWLSRLRAEHPRVCGENHTAMMQAKDAAGTSPRMRGKRPGQATLWGDIRNIPAYAGKTGLILTSGLTLTEHPRVCGENMMRLALLMAGTGTSPRMRGKREHGGLAGSTSRNIPAYAGKTRVSIPAKGGNAEHPRVCGENQHVNLNLGAGSGTSPRMRGKLLVGHLVDEKPRNIPAYAGKTLSINRSIGAPQEHPRVCGENSVANNGSAGRCGTSPRMRGKRRHGSQTRHRQRNIPAYAGKTCDGFEVGLA